MNLNIVLLTKEIVVEVANLHLEAFPEYLSTRLGRGYVKAYITWFCQSSSALALAAIDEQQKVIGYAVGAPMNSMRSLNGYLLWRGALGILVRPWLFLRTGLHTTIVAYLRSFLARDRPTEQNHDEPRLPEPIMVLHRIVVSPSARRKGVGTLLVRAFEGKARNLLMRSLYLTVFRDNKWACHLYESCAWQNHPQNRDIHLLCYFRILA